MFISIHYSLYLIHLSKSEVWFLFISKMTLSKEKYAELEQMFPSNKVDRKDKDEIHITSHISSPIQNLILAYPVGFFKDEVFDTITTSSSQISNLVVDEYYTGKTWPETYSEVFCPLIWTALKKQNPFIPDEWITTDPIIVGHADNLSNIEGWCEYAMKILTNPEPINNLVNEFTPEMFDIAKLIADPIAK